MSESSTTRGQECNARAIDVAWWEKVKSINTMIKPIIDLLRVVDGLLPSIGKVYEAMDRMIEQLKALVPDEHYDEIKSLCVTRWNAYYPLSMRRPTWSIQSSKVASRKRIGR